MSQNMNANLDGASATIQRGQTSFDHSNRQFQPDKGQATDKKTLDCWTRPYKEECERLRQEKESIMDRNIAMYHDFNEEVELRQEQCSELKRQNQSLRNGKKWYKKKWLEALEAPARPEVVAKIKSTMLKLQVLTGANEFLKRKTIEQDQRIRDLEKEKKDNLEMAVEANQRARAAEEELVMLKAHLRFGTSDSGSESEGWTLMKN